MSRTLKLSYAQAEQIRRLARRKNPPTIMQIAMRYGVSDHVVWKAIHAEGCYDRRKHKAYERRNNF